MIAEPTVGQPVKIDWYGDGSLYVKGYAQRKLRTNYLIHIPKEINPGWAHRTERASIPVEALIEVPEGFKWPKEKAMVTGQIINGGN